MRKGRREEGKVRKIRVRKDEKGRGRGEMKEKRVRKDEEKGGKAIKLKE